MNNKIPSTVQAAATLLALTLAVTLLDCSTPGPTLSPPWPSPSPSPIPASPVPENPALQLDRQESQCIRAQSQDQDLDRVRIMQDLNSANAFNTEIIIRCLSDRIKTVLILRASAGTTPRFSDPTWACIQTETGGLNLTAALRARQGLPTNEGIDHAILARAAVLLCVNDDEYQANATRLDANTHERLAIRCMAQAAGGVRQLARLSVSSDPETVADYRAHSDKYTSNLELPTQ